MTPEPGQVWQDNRDGRKVTVTEVTTPERAEPTVWVRYASGRVRVFAASQFGQSGRLGFTRVEATTDRLVEDGS